MLKLTIVAGARPNFMKIAPIIHEIQKRRADGFAIDYTLVHTGQHYDRRMSGSFFEELNIPDPDVNLNCSGGTQAEQTASILLAFEAYLLENPCNLLIVVGDVTSTMACTLVAKKLGVKVAHIEGGIRSHDWSMPEEINRIVTDSISDYFFTTSELANNNLLKQGVDKQRIFFVGNTMIDTLIKNRADFKKPKLWNEFGLKEKEYIVLTMHRPANVDEARQLKAMLNAIIGGTKEFPIIFPVHPRTGQILKQLDIMHQRLHKIPPLAYLEFNYLVERSKVVITDSGGITEEASILNVPCLTLRDNTERPETIALGTNELVGTNPKNLKPYLEKLFDGDWKTAQPIPLWDGKTAERIIQHIVEAIV